MKERADCIFCRITTGEIKTELLHQDDKMIAFRDINPLAPTHVLIVPRKHIPSLAKLSGDEAPLIGSMVNIANRLARSEGIAERGYRLVINCGREGGQGVAHLHMHLLGGCQLGSKLS